MRLSEIQIDRFAIWSDLRLSIPGQGLTVICGPNEAGKTTLLRFIRGILYGYQPADKSRGRRRFPVPKLQDGRLRMTHAGREFDLRRVSQGEGRGIATTTNNGLEQSADDLLKGVLQGIGENTFEHVFAVGLHELQELATLHDDEVAQLIYGLSLGPEGQQLLGASERIGSDARRLFHPDEQTGELLELFDQYDVLSDELDSLNSLRNRHGELLTQKRHWESLINDQHQRQRGLHSQLRGHLFLERIWQPWQSVRKIEADLDALPTVTGFPKDGLSRLTEINEELDTALKCRNTLIAEADDLHQQIEDLDIDADFQKHIDSIQNLVDQREWLIEVEARKVDAERTTAKLEQDYQRQLQQLGGEWSPERLADVDTSPGSQYRMLRMARNYETKLHQRSRLKRRYQQLLSLRKKRIAEWEEASERIGITDIDEALADSDQMIQHLKQLSRLKRREAQLEQRRSGFAEQLEHVETDLKLPDWVRWVLAAFVIAGLILGLVGLATGVTTNWIAGLIYAFLGATSAGLAWALKTHFEKRLRERAQRLQDELVVTEKRLVGTREAIAKIAHPDFGLNGTGSGHSRQTSDATPTPEADLIHNAVHHHVELQQLKKGQDRIDALRRRLTALRNRHQQLQREVSTVRQQWCELLVQLGLPETVSVEEAFDTWHLVSKAKAGYNNWHSAKEEWQQAEREWRRYRQRIENLGRRLHRWEHNYDAPVEVLDVWSGLLKSFAETRQQRNQLQREEEIRRAEVAEYQSNIDELTAQRSALFVKGGATGIEDFKQRAHWFDRREELEELLQQADQELEVAARTEPDLAMVEEDLLAFNADENAKCIRTINAEIEAIESDILESAERLGGIKQELTDIESDRRSSSVRLEREQVRTRLQQAAEQWYAVQLASQSIEEIRTRFERTCQPATLAAASQHLQRLSCGRYQNIWAPLGKRSLRIDDESGRTSGVEDLSGGTREQLFLSIRLALVQQLAEQGIELPMVLDDVFVNFDEERSEAAVNELLEFAGRGHQVLFFTCHQHLAQLFEQQGAGQVWLPAHNERVEERLAG